MSWAWRISETSTAPATANGWSGRATRTSSSSYSGRLRTRASRSCSDDPELDLAASHEIHDLLRMAGPDEQANVRVTLREADQDLRQDVGADRRRDGKRKLADDAVLELADERATAADRVHRPFRMRQEGATGRRQDHARMRSPEQACAQFLLERLEPGREGRLADREGVARRVACSPVGRSRRTLRSEQGARRGPSATIDQTLIIPSRTFDWTDDPADRKVSSQAAATRSSDGAHRGSPASGSRACSPPWIAPSIGSPLESVDDAGSLGEPRTRPYSFWAECECPGSTAPGTTRTSDDPDDGVDIRAGVDPIRGAGGGRARVVRSAPVRRDRASPYCPRGRRPAGNAPARLHGGANGRRGVLRATSGAVRPRAGRSRPSAPTHRVRPW